MKFLDVILNNNGTKCICCSNNSSYLLYINYANIPFRYLKYIKQYLFFVKICKNCYYNLNYKKEIYNKMINNTCILIDNF